MKYKIEKNTVQETLVIPLYGRKSVRSYTRISSGTKRRSVSSAK